MSLPEPYFERGKASLYEGDCRLVSPRLGLFDSVVTDPPYGLSFMGKGWDHGVPGAEFWEIIKDSCKPGAMLLAFGGTRTFHRLAVAIEDAGWEIRDCIMWVYGSGFPKSLDISKAIDKEAGAEREAVGAGKRSTNAFNDRLQKTSGYRPRQYQQNAGEPYDITAPATDAAKPWNGYGTALKPAYEPIIVAMKPLDGTFAHNAQTHGVAGINVDGCRIGTAERPVMVRTSTVVSASSMSGKSTGATSNGDTTNLGRFPANLILDEDAGELLDLQSGYSSELEQVYNTIMLIQLHYVVLQEH